MSKHIGNSLDSNVINEINNNLIGKKIAIIGLGVSNIPLLDYFKDIDCEVSLFNEKEITIDLSNYNYKVYEGNDCLKHLVGFDIIFRSPSCLPNRKEILDEIKKVTHQDLLTILKNIDQDFLYETVNRQSFKEIFFNNAEDSEIKEYLHNICFKN